MNPDQKSVLRTLLWLAGGVCIGIGGAILVQRATPDHSASGAEVVARTSLDMLGTGAGKTAVRGEGRPATAEAPESIAIPPKWQFAGVSSTRSGKNDFEWFSRYSPAELATIRKFNQLHPYAWNVHSPAEIAWMAQNGFPLPEDLFAADRMSDEDLRELAARAGGKAALLYYDRLSSERSVAIDTFKQEGGSVQEFAAANPQVQAEWERMYQVVRLSDSPFLAIWRQAALSGWMIVAAWSMALLEGWRWRISAATIAPAMRSSALRRTVR